MIDEEILSYYVEYKNGVRRKELLRDHIRVALSYSDEIEGSRAGIYAINQLGCKDFKELLQYAIIFHDIGKVFYQTEKHLKQGQEASYLSFIGHEFISAVLADEFLTEKLKLSDRSEDYTPVTFSVLYHHHAMNPETRQKYIKQLNKILSTPAEKQLYKDKIYDVLSDFLNSEDRKLLSDCLNKMVGTSPQYLQNSLEHLQSKIINKISLGSKPSVRKISLLLLDCLIACDYLAAQDREEGSSTFFHTISEFYDIWMRA